MVSYYNPLPYSQKHTASNLNYPPTQPWQWTASYPTPPNHQLLNEMESSHSHQVYYNTHHMFHPTGSSATEWHSPLSNTESLLQNVPNVQQLINESNDASVVGNSTTSSGRSTTSTGPPTSEITSVSESRRGISEHHVAESLPSPSLGITGSNVPSPEISLTTASSHRPSNSINNNSIASTTYNHHPSPVKAQYYEWMKKPSYPSQPAPDP
ncbi:PREDICTED: homeotic protein caudal-like [Rhagoletis zephyria]|uniref:homeotic protein caudal-like n=1 Tax=Rhagoletis zephyria TaxID=28612 RepID=UPI00081153F9|nr:PREDICTED: homeotic protein caudal-like [Rhagoletis zephyria]XP_036322059.1 homeotic protein caudal [Rhagoletis pomonella]